MGRIDSTSEPKFAIIHELKKISNALQRNRNAGKLRSQHQTRETGNIVRLRATMVRLFRLSPESVARATSYSRPYVARVLSPRDSFEGSPEFFRILESKLGTIIESRSSQLFMVFTRTTLTTVLRPVMDTVKKTLESLDRCDLVVAEVSSNPDFRIIGGDVALTVNSFATKKFIFPPQEPPPPPSYSWFIIIGFEEGTNTPGVIWKSVPE